MKTLFFFVLFLPVLCLSQSYDRMVKENSFYNYFMVFPFPPNTYDHTVCYKFSDTVLIDTLRCIKLIASADTSVGWDFTGAYLYEDTINESVYLIDGDTIGLLYDFSIDTGDTIFVYNPIQGNMTIMMVAESTDSIFYNGKYHKTISFGYDYWIEGIGSLYGILHPGSSLVGSTEQLVCFYLDMQMEYANPAYSSCFYTAVSIEDIDQQVFICKIEDGRISVFSENKIDVIVVSNVLGQILKKISVDGFQACFDMPFMQNELLLITCSFLNNKLLTKTMFYEN